MVESFWFEDSDLIHPKIIERNGISVAIRGSFSYRISGNITVPKAKEFDDYWYHAVRVFFNDTKSVMMREAKEKALKYKDDYEDIRVVPMRVKGIDVVVMYAREKEIRRSSPKYVLKKVISSKYSKL